MKMNYWIAKALSLLIAVILFAIAICGFYLTRDDNEVKQDYLNYCVYVNKYTGEAFIYTHGRFEAFQGADGKQIVVDIDEGTDR